MSAEFRPFLETLSAKASVGQPSFSPLAGSSPSPVPPSATTQCEEMKGGTQTGGRSGQPNSGRMSLWRADRSHLRVLNVVPSCAFALPVNSFYLILSVLVCPVRSQH